MAGRKVSVLYRSVCASDCPQVSSACRVLHGGTRGRLGLLVPEETDQTVAWVRTPGLCLQSSKGLRWPGAGLAHLYV